MYEDFTETYGPLSEDVLTACEQYWRIALPQDYRHFLIEINGGKRDRSVFWLKNGKNSSVVRTFLGICNNKNINLIRNYTWLRFLGHVPKNMFPVARDSLGNFVAISLHEKSYGKVYFCDHEKHPGRNTSLIADSFTEFMEGLSELADEDAA